MYEIRTETYDDETVNEMMAMVRTTLTLSDMADALSAHFCYYLAPDTKPKMPNEMDPFDLLSKIRSQLSQHETRGIFNWSKGMSRENAVFVRAHATTLIIKAFPEMAENPR